MTVTAPAASHPTGPPSSLDAAWAARWLVLAVVIAADAMDLMDSTIVNVAGPSIRRSLGGGAATLQWLSAAYTLSFAVTPKTDRPPSLLHPRRLKRHRRSIVADADSRFTVAEDGSGRSYELVTASPTEQKRNLIRENG